MIVLIDSIRGLGKSRYLRELLLSASVAWLCAYGVMNVGPKVILLAIFLLILVLSLVRIHWMALVFIFLCPFHLVIKEIYPSIFTDLWREYFLLCMLASWFVHVCLMKLPLLRRNILNFLIIAYVLWGVVEITRSYSLLVGVAGFRFMFAFVPVYFVVLFTVERKRQIERYVPVILASGFVIAVIAILQFVLISVLGIATEGIAVDFSRRYIAKAAGIPFARAVSVLGNPNELGNFLLVCLTFTFVFSYCSSDHGGAHRRRLRLLLVVMLVALVFSLSRSSLIAFTAAIMSICWLTGKLKPVLIVVFSVVLLSLIFSIYVKALFEPVYTFSDPYFATLQREDLRSTFWQHPLVGHGFSLTLSVADKLGLSGRGVSIVTSDVYFFRCTNQIGLIGYALHFLVWLFFLKYSYVAARSPFVDEKYRLVAIANFGILIGLMVASVHTPPWEYISLSATYYVLGAMSVFCYQQTRRAEVIYRLEGAHHCNRS